jgi:hypothetical protein
MKKGIVLQYVGNGWITGVPDRDLTQSDIDHLKAEGVTVEVLIQSKLYEYPLIEAPAKVSAQKSGDTGKE